MNQQKKDPTAIERKRKEKRTKKKERNKRDERDGSLASARLSSVAYNTHTPRTYARRWAANGNLQRSASSWPERPHTIQPRRQIDRSTPACLI